MSGIASVEGGVLCFIDAPAFDVVKWEEGGLHYMQVEGLDVIAASANADELARKVGGMIIDLFAHLIEGREDEVRTEAEEATIEFIAERIGPQLLRYHRRQRAANLFKRFRAALATTTSMEWKVGPPSTPHGSVPALSG